ncbi:MAG: aconitate hydratase AcnA, partial [Actinobacteria bacterium]|nr:aconitate hydratase AcnA [Actinomycetota bacterium]
MAADSFGAKSTLNAGGRELEIFRIDALSDMFDTAHLPFSLKVLLENLLRNEGEGDVSATDIEALAGWDAAAEPSVEIAFSPARVLMQDFTGVPSVVDLAAMRDAVIELGGDTAAIEPLVPAELVIDHSVQVDSFGEADSFAINAQREFERNGERYKFLRWGQQAFEQFRVVPPDTGIVHQVNLEYLARGVFVDDKRGQAYPDTLVGTDSHTTMINGLGVLGWGVGGIEAEAAMLGQPVSMLIPRVLGVRLDGALPEGATATDLVLTVTELLRERGVVGQFVEFYGPGISQLPLADRATIGNMSPEFGSTCAIFPIDAETIRYLRFTGRPDDQVEIVEAYAREQGMWHDAESAEPVFSETLSIDLSNVVPSIAGPRRPQDRVPLTDAKARYRAELPSFESEIVPAEDVAIENGAVVIAAITSCTNTSNPSVMIAAGLLASKARARGLAVKPWVKTSLAPGSKVVTDYLDRAGLQEDLDALGFNLVGYGCTTCIGNSGPLPEDVAATVRMNGLTVCSVL